MCGSFLHTKPNDLPTIRRMQEEYDVIDLTLSPIKCVRRQLVFDDDEESIVETDTESIAHTVEWLDTPTHTIGFELEHDDESSFNVLSQSFLDEEVESYLYESPIQCK
jgi:hypothetical protein